MPYWTENDIPEQTGRTVIVTGANSGLGYEITRALAARNADVIMACRSLSKGEKARQQILASHPRACLEVMPLDLGSLDSVNDFAQAFERSFTRLDLLFNNAGVMATPFQLTEDGFEQQIGVNHLGHFALTGLLLDSLTGTPASRIVTVASIGLWFGRINENSFQNKNGYQRYMAYCQSKLANVMFAVELQRRLEAAGSGVLSLPAHPGLCETNLQASTSQASGNPLEGGLYDLMHATVSQSAAMGALPLLYAAVSPEARGGHLYGPDFLYIRGYPAEHPIPKRGRDPEKTRRLWEVSEELTGVKYL